MARRKSASSKHLAPGQAAGYLFQPERALACLARESRNAQIGIEAADDVAVQVNEEVVRREQLKHTIAAAPPFGDHSIDLWKTLSIWLDAAAANELDLTNCRLFLTTNARVANCFVRKLVDCKRGPRKIKKCLDVFLDQDFPQTVREYVTRLRAHEPKLVCRTLRCIEIIDASNASFGEGLRQQVAEDMKFPADIEADELIAGLLGWIHGVAMDFWRAGKPAWITGAAFLNQYHKLIRNCLRYKRIGLPARMINVSEIDRRKQFNKMFVHQLRAIKASRPEILAAIDDFFRCNDERLRLAAEGDLSSDDWLDFDDRLKRHWLIISEREKRLTPHRQPEEIGYSTFSGTIGFQTSLAQDEPQPYLTSGTFHRLANELHIRWHPEYNGRNTS